MTKQDATALQPTKLANLGEMSELLRRVPRPPIGFIVSQAVWDGLVQRWQAAKPFYDGALPPQQFGSVQMVVDPDLPDTEFETAFTWEAWRERTAKIRRVGGEEGRDAPQKP